MRLAIAFLMATLLLAGDAFALTWAGNSATPSSESQYSPSSTYMFQISATAGEGKSVSSVLLESNFSTPLFYNDSAYNSSSSYYFNFSSLGAGVYSYRWHAIEDGVWTSTDWFSYTLAKNISSTSLYLNGTEGNMTYLLGRFANFTATLPVANEFVYLNSSYPGFPNGTTYGYAPFSYSLNVSMPGTFAIIAYWPGNANYTSSNRTYYFGDSAPRYLDVSANPSSGSAYNSGTTYTFGVSWSSCINITDVWFESNHTGTITNYTYPNATNSSGEYSISIAGLPAGSFSYRWIANDMVGRSNATEKRTYNVIKATALSIQTPSANVTEGTNVTVRCILTNSQMGISSFKLYRGSTEIGNDTYYSRRDSQILDVGTYTYICNTTGNQNYTNQTLNYTVNVLSNYTPARALGIVGDSTISLQTGGIGDYTFSVNNTMGYMLSNLSVYVNGLDANWYTIGDIASSILDNTTIQGRISFSIPESASAGSYSFTLRVTGKTPSNHTNETSKSIILEITVPEQQSYPPTYSAEDSDSTANGNTYEFALKWVDDAGLSGYIFSSNITGEWVNDTLVPITGTEGWSYASKEVTPGTAVAWKFYMQDSDGMWSSSETFVLGSSASPGMDFVPIMLIVVIAAGVAVAFLVISQKKPGAGKEKVEYVYDRNDAV